MFVAPFEQFLVTSLCQGLENRITAGSRYQYQSPDVTNTRKLIRALWSKESGKLQYQKNGAPEVLLSFIEINNTKLICVAHSESTHHFSEGHNEHFIAGLRDAYAIPQLGCALLIIHNSNLDTLINSADDLASEGETWSPDAIGQRLTDHYTSQVKQCKITLNLLVWQTTLIKEEGESMFGFEPLFNAVSSGKEPDLTSLGLLPDADLALNNNDKQIQKRLEENRQLKEKIATVVEHFPEEISERLPELGDKFIKAHINGDQPDWEVLDIQKFWDEMTIQRKQALSFHTIESDTCTLIGPRNKSETAAGKREKHIILLASKDDFSVPLMITFFGYDIEKKQFSVKNNKTLKNLGFKDKKGKGKNLGKYYLSTEIPWDGQPVFLTLRLNRAITGEKYTFHILVLLEDQFYLPAFENHFLVNPKEKLLVLQTSDQELVINPELNNSCPLTGDDQVIATSEFGVVNYQDAYEQSDLVQFAIESEDHQLRFQIEGEISQESLTLPLLMDEGRFNLLFNDNYNGQFIPAKGRVVLDNQENKVVFIRLKLLELEHQLIDQNWLYLDDKDSSQSSPAAQIGRFAPDLHDAWQELTDYFSSRQTLPSLASWGPELVDKIRTYVAAYIEQLDALPLDKSLTIEARLLLKIGYVHWEGREFFSPLHPLVLAYYLYLVDSIGADEAHRSFKNLPPVTRKRLNPRGLLPFTFSAKNGFSYTQVVEENHFWLEIVPRQETSYDFVSKVIREKVEEFIKTFGELFKQVESAPLIINSINNGENREIFQGLLGYYQSHLLSSRCIHVNLYDSELRETEFDRFAEMGSYNEIKKTHQLDKSKARENADTIIDLLRTRLSFSKFRHSEQAEQAYAHLSFFKNDQKIDCVDIDMDKHSSGLACDGLLNGESSRSEHGSYYTAFGLENIAVDDKPHLKLARLIGRLLKPARLSNTVYTKNTSIGLAVSDAFRVQLERSYASSIWTTVIDPKVTLDFFQSKNQLLIHYSDQYTSSAGYDAITVTQQKDLYRRMLSHGGDDLIGEYNAFNGEWLLKMITDKEPEQKAKHGVIGAWKVVSTLLGTSDITWVPLSVAEMIRVASNIGLKMSESDFAPYHKDGKFKGKISDDILFAGFRDGRLYLMPVEVKTGSHGSSSLQKAREQTLALGRYMEEGLLAPQTLEGKIYRGLFIRQVLMQIEKYELYQVFEARYFDEILNKREYWLQGDYSLGHVRDYPKGMVVAHLDGEAAAKTRADVIDDVLQLEIPFGFLDMLVAKPLGELQPMLTEANHLAIPKKYYMTAGLEGSVIDVRQDDDEEAEDADEDTSDDDQITPEIVADKTPTKPEPLEPADSEALKVLFGSDMFSGHPVYWEPTNTNKLLNPNTAIIGTMGTGKTQFTKSLITQLVRNQHRNVDGLPVGILIFDYKADYVKEDFVQATSARVFELYHLPFNPLALFGNKPMLPVHTANLFCSTLSTAFNLGVKQQNKIHTLVMQAYQAAGIVPQDKTTWNRPTPTVQQVWDLFMAQEKIEEDSLYAALYKLISFQIFEPNPENTQSLYDLVNGVTVINLSGYDPQIQNLIVAMTLDIFYNQMHQQGSSKIDGPYRQLSKFILVDEADNFMKQNFPSLRMIMKEGREFGVGTILSTQELSHFKTTENNYASYILSWIVHQVKEIKAQDVRMVFKTSSKTEDDKAIEQIQGLEKHVSLYLGGRDKPRKIKDKAFWELINS